MILRLLFFLAILMLVLIILLIFVSSYGKRQFKRMVQQEIDQGTLLRFLADFP